MSKAQVNQHPEGGDTPNSQKEINLTAADLPLHCPLPGMSLWDSHPRVFLPVSPGGSTQCPYCGTRFVLP